MPINKSHIIKNISETFRNRSETLKNIVLAVAIIFGGGWTLFTFLELDTVNHSKAELKALNVSVFRQPVLHIEMELKQEHLGNDKHRYIAGYVRVENIGKENAVLRFQNNSSPFTATEVSFAKSGKMSLGKKYHQYPPKYAGYVVRASDIEKIPFFIQVGKAGLYFVDFEVNVCHQDVDGTSESNGKSWSSSKYIKLTE